ncbi:hypothetical protein ES332_A09G135700v1 [Gossypium tomentosum]|uniref:Uncharacterized protein n=1 Tax=Gossypium tomentosum TaxID=34277 RepID=A0A5D2P3S5_GOSTO|nr:hypothetical protein ES332_A09G135700v1 [Gossypium tomentosum]
MYAFLPVSLLLSLLLYRFAKGFIALNYCLFWKEIGRFLVFFDFFPFLALPFLCICCLFPFLAGDSRRFRWLGLLSWIRISADTHMTMKESLLRRSRRQRRYQGRR